MLSAKGQAGLLLVHEPAPAQPICDDNYPLDIIFVHGLNGDSKNTWTHKNGTFWPRDLLPTSMPGSRIYSYGFDSRVFFSASDADYRDLALDLMESVRALEFSTVFPAQACSNDRADSADAGTRIEHSPSYLFVIASVVLS